MSSKLTSGPKLLEVKNVVVHYGKTRALKQVSVGTSHGEIVALIGANGAGKSTILRVVSGLVKPSSGEVIFDKRRINGSAAHEIAKLGIAHVPEGRRLFAKMSVSENLLTGCRDKKVAPLMMEKVFEHFPVLRARTRQRAGTLSGGEQQMLAIGRGLMAEPRLMLLDEPSLGLSPMMTLEIGRIVVEINRDGTSVLLAEQNARLALTLSQRGYVLETGVIALEGKTEDLIHNEKVIQAYLSA
jgi:branched-chain amino acid transport system ATP-binding protein